MNENTILPLILSISFLVMSIIARSTVCETMFSVFDTVPFVLTMICFILFEATCFHTIFECDEGLVQSDDLVEASVPRYYGPKYCYFRFDDRLGDMDALMDIRPSRAAKRRCQYKRRLERHVLGNMRLQALTMIQSGDEGIFSGLDALKRSVEHFREGEFVIKLIEDVVILAYQLMRSRNKMDITVSVTSFAKARLSKSLTATAAQHLLDMKLSELFSVEEIQSADSPFAPLRQMLDNYSKVRELPIFKKLYKFSMYALSLSLFESAGITFDTFGYKATEKAFLKEKYTQGPDFVHCLLDTTLFVCERGFQCYKLRSLQPLIHSGSSYEKWCDDVRLIKLHSTCLMNPRAHGFTYFDFLSRLDDAIEKGDAIIRYVRGAIGSKDRTEGIFLQRYLDDLRLIRSCELTKRAAREGRSAPFSALIYGGSSVGKSTFQDMLFCHYAKVFDLPSEAEYKYTRVFTDEYWSGFNTSQWCIVMDDMAFRKAGYSLGDKSLDEMLQIVNNVPFTPPQADLPDKGKIPLKVDLVLGTTNAEHLNAYAYFHNALAVQRRMPYIIEIAPKAEFTRDGVFLDSSKVTELGDGEYPNIWDITLKRVVPNGTSIVNQTATYETMGVYSDIDTFLVKFTELALAHQVIQKKVLAAGNTMVSVKICAKCYRTKRTCVCDEFQPRESFASTELDIQTGDQLEFLLNNTLRMEGIHYASGPVQGRVVHMWLMVLVFVLELMVYIRQKGWFFPRLFSWLLTTRLFTVISLYVARRVTGLLSRRFLRHLGERAEFHLSAPVKIISIVKCLLVVVSTYKTYKMVKSLTSPTSDEKRTRAGSELTLSMLADEEDCLQDDVQGNVYSTARLSSKIGVRPLPEGPQKESVWMKNDYRTSCEDVNPLTIGWKSMEQTAVLSSIRNNCCTFISRRNEGGLTLRRDNRAICVGGQVFMTNSHGLPATGDVDLEVIFGPAKDGVTPNLRMTLQQSSIHRVPEKDLAFIEIRNLPPHKNIARLFPQDTLSGKYTGAYVAIDECGAPRRYNVDITQNAQEFIQSTSTHKFDRSFKVWRGFVDRDTLLGDCGSPLVAFTQFGPAIIGIHFLGGKNCAVGALAVTHSDVVSGMNHFGTLHVQNGPPDLSAPGVTRDLINLHPKASIRYIPEGSAKVYGSFSGMRSAHVSHVRPTHISAAVVGRGYAIKTGAPVMRGWEPWNLALKDMVKPSCNIDEGILKHCVEAFTKDILRGVGDKLSGLVILDNLTAINGAPGVSFIDKMNRNTSMGNPWKKSKMYFLKSLNDTTVWQDGVDFTDAVLDRVDSIIDRYRNGVRVKPNFCGHLKDEPVSFAKIAAGKTRIFTGGPADWSMVVRKYLLSFVKVVQDNRYVFEAGPGTICQSLEWEEMFEYLTQHGPANMVAGDYGKFDKKMVASFILAAFDIIINVHRAAGWTEDELLVLKGIATDVAFPLVDLNGELIEFYGTNPSGHPLTVIINCLVNSLYLRYCYTKMSPTLECSDFKDNVAVMTYGDDNVFGVSSRVSDWFNHSTVQEQLAIIGVEYTMADKTSETVPLIHIDEIAFLKRRWRWDDDIGAMVCPLEHDSIEKMLTMCVESKTVCPQAQAVDIIESALNEYFYYGKETFLRKRLMMMEIIEETGIQSFVVESTLPTWNQLNTRFWDASEHVELGRYRSNLTPQRPCELRRMSSRRGVSSNPIETLSDSYCSTPLDKGEERMGLSDSAPERSSKSVFTEAPGTGVNVSKDESGFGESLSGNQPPTNTQTQESTDYKKQDLNLLVQSEDFEEILDLSDAEIGHLVRITWHPGQYVRFKRMLWAEHRRQRRVVDALSPEEQVRLLHRLEALLEARNGDVQSGDVVEDTSVVVQQNMTFADGASSSPELLPSLMGPTYDGDADSAAQLSGFLSRPVMINQFTWPESSTTTFHTSFAPWALYFGTSQIAKKLDNFSRIHCKLHLKFVVNASPFYYGALRVVYSPLASPIYTTQPNDQVVYSQRPGIWIEPQSMTSVELELPFLTPDNWLDTNLLANFTNMGRIDYVQYAKLRSANGVVGTGITISCYAWAEDVTISGPTSALSVQSDEYVENTTVSDAATTIAGVAGKLTSVPFIGDFARATELGATAAAGIAKLFGYSNPPNISDVGPMQPKAFHAMANVDTCVPHDKLSLDAKNEITLSNTVAGTDGEDSLALSNLLTRESFLLGTLWDGSMAAQTLLLSWIVTPCPALTQVVGANTYRWFTPLSYFTALFAQWRGSIHYRLKFVKTKYHRGRVIVSWDPNADIALTSDTETTCFSRVVDLEFEDEVDFIVPYKAVSPWLSTAVYTNAVSNGTVPAYTLDKTRANGVVTVRVLNTITGPAASPQIDILLYVKAGDDYMLSVPQQLPVQTSYTVQSDDVISHESTDVDTYVCGVTVGESVASLRPLLHRTVFWGTQEVGAYATGAGYTSAGYILATNLFPRFPLSFGYSTSGMNWATDGVTNRRFNYCNVHPIDWVLNAFVGVRGSTVMQFNLHGESTSCTLGTGFSAERHFGTYSVTPTLQGVNRFSSSSVAGAGSSLARTAIDTTASVTNKSAGGRGMSLTNQRTQTSLSVVIPQYSNKRFKLAPSDLRVASDNENVRVDVNFRLNTNGVASVPWPIMDVYYAAGVDFNPVFFLSTPRLYTYALPTAVNTTTP